MSLDSIKLELPTKLKDICQLTFSFDNLIKVMDYFHNNNLIIVKEMKEMRDKVSKLEETQNDVDYLKIKSAQIEKVNDNINRSFINIKEKFLTFETKMGKFDEVLQKTEKNEKLLNGHEENLNNLNRVVDEHVNTIKEIQQNFGKNLRDFQEYEQEFKEMKNNYKSTHEIIEKNKIQILEDKTSNNREIGNIHENISEINHTLTTLKNEMQNKYRDLDNCINNIMDNISNLPPSTEKTLGENENNYLKLAMNEIERIKEKFNNFSEENKKILSRRDKEYETYKKVISEIKTEIENTNKKLITLSTDINFIKDGKPSSNRGGVAIDDVQKFNDNLRKMKNTISGLPNREEFDEFQRDLRERVEKIEILLNEMSPKEKLLGKDKTTQINSFAIIEKVKTAVMTEITDYINNMFETEGPKINISKNPQILEILKVSNKHTEEINNNYKSIINLGGTFCEHNSKIKFLEMQTSTLAEESNSIKSKIGDLINNIIGGGDDDDDAVEVPNYDVGDTIKKKLKILFLSNMNIQDKVSQLEKSINQSANKMKDDIEKKLKDDIKKTIDRFTNKLEKFTDYFEQELKNKIDQIGLDNFENKMNSKLYTDLKDKLNKNDMKKNNNMISRKIDSLENKISKTLVDTIIDLQMDDQPLIIKKNANNFDICASCNQLIPKESCSFNMPTEFNNISNHKSKFRKNFNFTSSNFNQSTMPKITKVVSPKNRINTNNNNNKFSP